MSKSLTYALLGTGAAVAVYFVARRMSASAPPPKADPSPVAQVVGGIKDIYEAIRKRKPSTGIEPTEDTPISVTPVVSGDGASAISNSSGLDKATGYTTMPTTPNYRERATIGVVNYSHYAVAHPPAVAGTAAVRKR